MHSSPLGSSVGASRTQYMSCEMFVIRLKRFISCVRLNPEKETMLVLDRNVTHSEDLDVTT